MVQIGEAIKAPEFLSDEDHNEKTCPWHDEDKKKEATPMEIAHPDTDSLCAIMPDNDGGKLGKNLIKSGSQKPTDTITLVYARDEVLTYKEGKKDKTVQTYTDKHTETFDLQYAPHHLIPGNESLAESKLVIYLGDDTVIKAFNKEKKPSKIKDKKTVGYDINCAENGVWLPSPYALSNGNLWPSVSGKKCILKIKGKEAVEITVAFQNAYVAAAIEKSGNRQFHMRHVKYSEEVKDILDGIAKKLKLMSKGACPIAKESEKDNKFEPPSGLVGRLNTLSSQLKRLLIGSTWHPPFYADDNLMSQYIATMEIAKGIKPKIEHIL